MTTQTTNLITSRRRGRSIGFALLTFVAAASLLLGISIRGARSSGTTPAIAYDVRNRNLVIDWSDTSAAYVPSDSVAVPGGVCNGVYVGTAGNVALKSMNGNVATFKNVASGSVLPLRCTNVMATNTTASDIVPLY